MLGMGVRRAEAGFHELVELPQDEESAEGGAEEDEGADDVDGAARSTPGGRVVDHAGARSAVALRDWALSLLPNVVSTVEGKDGLARLLARAGGPLVKGAPPPRAKAATWHAAALLVTDKDAPPPMWKALAGQFAGRVAFGVALKGGRDTTKNVAALKGKPLPIVAAFCNGDPDPVEVYGGALKASNLESWLFKFANGRITHHSTQCQCP